MQAPRIDPGRRALLLALLLLWGGAARAASPAATAASGLDLKEAFALALRQSETVAISEEAIQQAEEEYRQAVEAVPPRLSFHAQDTWQDTAGVPAGFGGFFKPNQPQAGFKLHLPGLTGYRELATLKAATAFTAQARRLRDRAAQLLYLEVAQAFYGTLQNLQDVETTRAQLSLTQDRIRQLEEWEFVGRSREAEVVAAQSQLAGLEASLEGLTRVQQASQDLLAFLVGCPVAPPFRDTTALPGRADPSDLALEQDTAAHSRPDVLAAEESVRLQEAAVKAAWAGHLPVVTFDGNYYLYRTGILEESRWDALLQLDLPLFSWGQVASQVRQAESQARVARLQRQLAERSARLDAENAWKDLESALEQLQRLERAADLAQRNYDLQTRDYRRGLVTNLDVLQALNALYQARVQRDEERYRVKINAVALAVATGVVPLPKDTPP